MLERHLGLWLSWLMLAGTGCDFSHTGTDSKEVVVQENTKTSALAKSTMIPKSFFMYNDFACSSNNKWLLGYIPVR